MKTAVSIPDRLFARLDGLARALGKSRSRLYAEALAEYVLRHAPDEVTAALDRVYGSEEASADRLVREAARRVLRKSEW